MKRDKMPYNVIVLVKQIPDIDQMKTDPSTGEPILQNLPLRVENLSKNAIEAAVKIKEKYGGKVSAIIFGTDKSSAAMKESYAMGVDEGFLLTGYDGNHPEVTAKVLAEKIKTIPHDLIILGNQSADSYTGLLPGKISAITGEPLLGNAIKIEMDGKTAKVKNIEREDMDRFSMESHRKAARALDEGFFKDEILPIDVEKDDDFVTIDRDQSIRPDTTMEGLRALQPAFVKDGKITAGNSSPLNAGASLTMLMSGKKVREYGLKPLAKLSSFAWAAVDPTIMGLGPVPASQKLLKNAGLSAEDIDVWEINEAFAVVVLNAIRELGLDEKRVNLKGGAIAIGHPLGASGARLGGTVSRLLNTEKKEKAVATLCVGGGQGYSVLFERV